MKGLVFFTVNEKNYHVTAGDIIFSMPGEIRSWDKNHIRKGYALIFEEDFLLSFFNDPFFLRNLSFFNHQRVSACLSFRTIYSRISKLNRQIYHEIHHFQPQNKHILRALLYEMLSLLDREYQNQFPETGEAPFRQNRYVNAFIALVKTDCKRFHQASYYADRLCITPNYLNEIIKKSLGINPKLYIQNQLLLEAKKMVSYSDLSIADIADMLHFESVSYFIHFFRNHTGCSPLIYRKAHKH